MKKYFYEGFIESFKNKEYFFGIYVWVMHLAAFFSIIIVMIMIIKLI